MTTQPLSVELEPTQFRKISHILYQQCGIELRAGKEELVKARLLKRLKALKLQTFAQYIKLIEHDKSGEELTLMIDALTTNKTSFFREAQHFEYLRRHILPHLSTRHNPIRLWSAGCSTGEEPFSLAVLLWEYLPDVEHRDVRILATDISTQTLEVARQGVYGEEALRGMPERLLGKYFLPASSVPPRTSRLRDNVKSLVRLARLNLMASWPMRGPFDVIFCRNVMIYFDKSTQQRLVGRFRDILAPGGFLFVGHAESLVGSAHGFHYVQPAIYVK